ncbi:MAG: toprim domain-containing protein, partial [Nanoarchaeota archaeon]
MRKPISDFLNEIENCEFPFIVEGKKDAVALKRIGAKQTISLSGPMYAFIEKISSRYKKVVILTDLDAEGKKLYSMLHRGLSERGV